MSKQPRHPLAFCPVHGVFETKLFPMGPGSFVHFAGLDTTCPTCNGRSEIISGLYETKADRLNILLDPSISVEALAAVRELALKLQRGKITPAEATKVAEKIHPKAGRLFDLLRKSNEIGATQLAAAIITAAGVIIAARMNSAPTQNQTVIVQPTVIERVLSKDDLLTTSSLSSPKIPLPRPRPTIPNEGKKHPRQNRG